MPLGIAGGRNQAWLTYQTPDAYEAALERHAQKFQWLRGFVCACADPNTGQPDPLCTVCRGRGRVYKPPNIIHLEQELAKHDEYGTITPKHAPYVGTPVVRHQGQVLALAGTQPADKMTIKLQTPALRQSRLFLDYDHSLFRPVTDEDSEVYGTNTLRVLAGTSVAYGKTFRCTIQSVSRVYNVTRDETYTVLSWEGEFIYLDGMTDWVAGDVLEVDYSYVEPANFVIFGVSPKIRYERPYVMDQADGTLVAPYWAKIGPNDIVTALAQEQVGQTVIHPAVSGAGDDVISGFWHVSRITSVISISGYEYDVLTDVQLRGRNSIHWIASKPTQAYSVEFLYHPTWVALTSYHSLKTAENKSFVNRVNVMKQDNMGGTVP